MKNEPVMTFVTGGMLIFNAAIATLGEFWHPLTAGQILALNSLASAVLSFIARSRVTPI